MSEPDVTQPGRPPAIDLPRPGRVGEPAPPRVSGYDIVRLLGTGGMGVVWEAIEHRFERRVALKVQDERKPAIAGEDLFREARLAALIDDPALVRVQDFGFTFDEQPYYAMEYVEGVDLAVHIAEGPIPTNRAMRLILDVVRAAAAAHERGIVHRDLKPRNIMVDASERARVLDFGIAVHAEAGGTGLGISWAGSPPYMAPEQVMQLPIGPEVDVHAIGVVLYEMLTGARPYRGDSPTELFRSIVSDPPPRVADLVPAIHRDIDLVIQRCLAKQPGQRFRSGRELFDVLMAMSEGHSVRDLMTSPTPSHVPTAAAKAAAKPSSESATRHFRQSWTFASPPERLWPYVANTDRLNRAVGLAPVNQLTASPTADFARTARLKSFGLEIEWQEYPFEWVRDREHRVHRAYRTGPLQSLWNHVVLARRADGGTDMTHTISVVTRGIVGDLAAALEIGQRVSRNMDRVYRRIDHMLSTGGEEDPFEESHRPSPEQIANVGRAATDLRERHGFDGRMVDRLVQALLYAPSSELGRMRPLSLASAWHTDAAATLDMFMVARGLGILAHAWDIVCPTCRVAHECVPRLQAVGRIGQCRTCGVTFERDLADSVELIFRPDDRVRVTERLTYCLGSPAARAHVFLQQVLEPREERIVDAELPPGSYEVCAAPSRDRRELVASAVGFASVLEASLREDESLDVRQAMVRAGAIRLTLRNETTQPATFRVESPGAQAGAAPASLAVMHPTFRAVCQDDHIAEGEYISIARQSFVCLEVCDVDALLRAHGDAATYARIEHVEKLFTAETEKLGGGPFGRPFTTGLLVGSFPNPVAATRAAIALARAIHDVPVRIAVHEGSSLAFTRGAGIHYFGRTLHESLALLRDGMAGELVFSALSLSTRPVLSLLGQERLSVRMTRSAEDPKRRVGRVALRGQG